LPRTEIIKRHDDWSEGKVTHVAWCLAQAGLKFGMLRQDNDRVFVFDMDQAMAFDGDTGPYCQYAATRFALDHPQGGWCAKRRD
jgi:arginyl-tRNA synthetase